MSFQPLQILAMPVVTTEYLWSEVWESVEQVMSGLLLFLPLRVQSRRKKACWVLRSRYDRCQGGGAQVYYGLHSINQHEDNGKFSSKFTSKLPHNEASRNKSMWIIIQK